MKTSLMEKCRLDELAEVQPGYPFRGKLPLTDSGGTYVVQFRHIEVGLRLSDKDGKILDRAVLTGRKKPSYLRSGDVLFMAKGTRNHAAVIGDVPANTVCTPNFYHIRIRPEARNLMAEFLAWQLNHRGAQRYFASCSQGSVAPSITKTQLGSLSIIVPPIAQQDRLVKLARAAVREEKLMNQLIENRRQLINSVGGWVLQQNQNPGARDE